MPTYDLECGCEAILPWSADPSVPACPECGAETRRRPATCRTIGIIWSNPIVFDRKAGDRGAFHSKEQLRAWEAKHPDREIVSTESSTWRAHKDEAHEAADADGKAQGYLDHEHRSRTLKEKNRKRLMRNEPGVQRGQKTA